MHIRPATPADLDDCFALDQALNEDRPNASTQGFLISGDQRMSYEAYCGLGAFWVAETEGRIAGFLFALPPDTPHFNAVRANREHFQLSRTDIWDLPSLAWVGKIAVQPDFMRRGIARTLYQELFMLYPQWNLLTIVPLEPLPNVAAYHLHEHLGFEAAGNLPLGNRGSLKNVYCGVYFRPSGQAS